MMSADDTLAMSYALAGWAAGRDEIVAIDAKRELQRVFPRHRTTITPSMIDEMLRALGFRAGERTIPGVALSAVYRRGAQRRRA